MSTKAGNGEGSIDRLPQPNTWRVRVSVPQADGTSRRITRTVKGTRSDAKQVRTILLGDVLGGRIVSRSDITVAQLLDDHIATSTVEDSTKAKMRGLHAMLGPLGEKRITTVIARDVRAHYRALQDRGLSGARIRTLHQALAKAFDQARNDDLILSNPVRTVEPPSAKSRKIQWPTVEQVERIIAEVDQTTDRRYTERQHRQVIYVLAAQTGMRRGELCGLRWEHVDLTDGQVTVCAAIGVNGRQGYAKDTKTGDERKVFLLPVARAELAVVLQSQREACLAGGLGRRPVYVCSDRADGSEPIYPPHVSSRWRHARNRAGLPTVRLHDLRHAAATLLLRAGVDPVTAAETLGHSPDVFLRIYAGTDDQAVRDACEKLARHYRTGEA